jgi:hypothetical protein
MHLKATNWLLEQRENRRANCIFLIGLMSASQAEAENLGFAEIASSLMNVIIEARYTVLDELLDTSTNDMLLSRADTRN